MQLPNAEESVVSRPARLVILVVVVGLGVALDIGLHMVTEDFLPLPEGFVGSPLVQRFGFGSVAVGLLVPVGMLEGVAMVGSDVVDGFVVGAADAVPISGAATWAGASRRRSGALASTEHASTHEPSNPTRTELT
jgi:hypothetical protein